MKNKIGTFLLFFTLLSFGSGRQFRPPAFNICKIRPEHKKCLDLENKKKLEEEKNLEKSESDSLGKKEE